MKCPKCQEEGKKSLVYCGMGTSTCMYCPPFYDEEGKYHNHDRNSHTQNYSCSEGHNWSENIKTPCPTCGENWI